MMAEQGNLFGKLDEIKSSIDDLKKKNNSEQQPVFKDKEEVAEFIATAERTFIYNGQVADFNYKYKSWKKNTIVAIILLAINIIVALIPFMIYADSAILSVIPFGLIAICNIPFIVWLSLMLADKTVKSYKIPYNEYNKFWKRLYYDDNGIIYKSEYRGVFKFLKWATPYFNIAAGIFTMILSITELIPFYVTFCVVGLALIFFTVKINRVGHYSLYFIQGDKCIPYGRLFKFMRDNNLK